MGMRLALTASQRPDAWVCDSHLSRRQLTGVQLHRLKNALGETVRVLSKPLQCRFAGEQEYVRVIHHAMAPTTGHALTGLQCEHRIRAGKHRTVEVRIREELLLMCGAHEQIRAALVNSAPTSVAYNPPLLVL